MIARLILVFALALLATGAAAATEGRALSAEDRADVARIERYLDAIRSYRSAFFQIAPDGQVSEGTFSLQRPGRLRFDYEPPSPIEIVADGTYLHYYDRELGQINSFAIDDTPIGIIMADKIRFSGRVRVGALKRGPGVIALTLFDQDDPAMGSLTLVFADAPLELRQWKVTDARGLETTVAFLSGTINPKLDPALFVFDDPRADIRHGKSR